MSVISMPKGKAATNLGTVQHFSSTAPSSPPAAASTPLA